MSGKEGAAWIPPEKRAILARWGESLQRNLAEQRELKRRIAELRKRRREIKSAKQIAYLLGISRKSVYNIAMNERGNKRGERHEEAAHV